MKKKLIIATSLVLAIAVAVFGLFTYQHQQKIEKAKQEREKYQNYDYYTGKIFNGKSILINFWRMVRVLQFIGSH